MREAVRNGSFEGQKRAKKPQGADSKINCLIQRIREAVEAGFTGTIRFEINFSQGGIRTIKSSVEDLVKF